MPNLFGTEEFKTLAMNVLPILKNSLRLNHLISNQYDAGLVNKDEGSTITVKRPVIFKVNEFTGQIIIQNLSRRLVDIKLDTLTDISFELSVEEMTFIMNKDQKKINELFEPAFAAIADDSDERIAKLWKDTIPFFTGDPAKPYDNMSSVTIPRKKLVDRKTPAIGRRMLLSTAAYAELSTLDGFVNLNKSGTTELLKNANLGHKFGFDMYETQVDLTHIVGDGITGAAGDITSTANSTPTVPANNNDVVNAEWNTIPVSGLSATGTVKKGDLFEITQNGQTYQFIVREDAVAVAGAASLKVFPVYREQDQSPIIFGSGSILTFAGKTIGSYDKSIAYHEKAFAFVPVGLPNMSGTGVKQTVVSAEGLSFRMTFGYDQATKKGIFSIDMLAGYATLYPELAEIVIGGQ